MQQTAIQREIARAKHIIDRLNDHPSRQAIARYIAELEARLVPVRSVGPEILI
ncbi:hypothetical protein [Sphingomonas lacusdianchii]|jgi:hypothetical protein|uniref:hypothetical protein n=1 Tax=Sphingomonas lacusdianchii TaxID=2917992 RepID=UPI001F596178|nr:hypothetical protein [Sphingomonas sp. JXJ CY 53]